VTPEQRVTAAIDCTPYAKATPDAIHHHPRERTTRMTTPTNPPAGDMTAPSEGRRTRLGEVIYGAMFEVQIDLRYGGAEKAEYIADAVRLGAAGYLLKGTSGRQVVEAIPVHIHHPHAATAGGDGALARRGVGETQLRPSGRGRQGHQAKKHVLFSHIGGMERGSVKERFTRPKIEGRGSAHQPFRPVVLRS